MNIRAFWADVVQRKVVWAERLSSIFFWVQCPVALVFGFPQFFHTLSKGSEGVSPIMMICGALFCGFLILLTLDDMRIQTTKNMKRYLFIASTGLFNYSLILGALIYTGLSWKPSDHLATVLVSISVVVTTAWLIAKKQSPKNPQFKGMIAFVLKVIPQLAMAYRIWIEGSTGLGAFFVWIFHFFCILRLLTIWVGIWSEGWSIPKKWLLYSELGNYGSWVIVTVVWYLVR